MANKKTKKVKDSIEPLPPIINDPKKITNEENLSEKKLKIRTIPLKIKPIKAPLSLKKENKSNLKSKSTIKFIIVFALLFLNVCLLVDILSNEEKPNISYSNYKKKTTSNILGNWLTSNEGLFIFSDDYTFYWYESYQNQNNNYYAGTYNYKKGIEALTEMGYTEEEFYTTFGEDVTLDNVYSINIFPTLAYKGNQDTSTRDLNENETWWFILIVKEDNTAIGYNKTLDLRYNLTLN